MGDSLKTTAITLTGDRPEAFKLCKRWMIQQTVKVDQWLVVDDGKVPMVNIPECEYIRRTPKNDDPAITIGLNLEVALMSATGDNIVIIEDDEYYASNYVEEMVKRLQNNEVVGIGQSKYYHVAGGYIVHENMLHASLAQTAFRKDQIPLLKQSIPGNGFIDLRFWNKLREKKIKYLIFNDKDKSLYVGIKGLPGRYGIGNGHDMSAYGNKDNDRSILRKWIPKDYQVYLDLLKQTPIQKLNTRRYDMSMYKAKIRGLIGKRLVEPGEIFSWDGPKGSWMIPVAGEIPVPNEGLVVLEKKLDIYQAAAELTKKPASVLNHINIPSAAPALPTEPAKMGRPKSKVKK